MQPVSSQKVGGARMIRPGPPRTEKAFITFHPRLVGAHAAKQAATQPQRARNKQPEPAASQAKHNNNNTRALTRIAPSHETKVQGT